MSKQPGATQCPSCGKGNQSAQCWNCGCDWSLPSEIAPNDVAVQELRNIVEAKRFNRANFPDDTEFANWAQSRCRFILGRIEASRSATRTLVGWIQERKDGRPCFYEGELDPREVHDNGCLTYPVYKP